MKLWYLSLSLQNFSFTKVCVKLFLTWKLETPREQQRVISHKRLSYSGSRSSAGGSHLVSVFITSGNETPITNWHLHNTWILVLELKFLPKALIRLKLYLFPKSSAPIEKRHSSKVNLIICRTRLSERSPDVKKLRAWRWRPFLASNLCESSNWFQ